MGKPTSNKDTPKVLTPGLVLRGATPAKQPPNVNFVTSRTASRGTKPAEPK